MKIFIDSANLSEIEEALKRGFARGITTNPSILAKEPKSNFEVHIGKIADLIGKYQPDAHLSVEVFSRDTEEILRQAKKFKKDFNLPGLSIKIQIGWEELEVVKILNEEEISVNCTCNMTVSQAVMAAAAGAEYVSFFWGRIRDGGNDKRFSKERNSLINRGVLSQESFIPDHVVSQAHALFVRSYPDTKIIVGSIRTVNDIINAGIAGAHIVTVPPKFFKDSVSHFKTDEVVTQFLNDFKNWLK